MNIKELTTMAHEAAKANGWWDEERNEREMIMLIISELSEAVEAHRKGNMCTVDLAKVTDFKKEVKDTFEDEIADAVIRILDLTGFMDAVLTPHRHDVLIGNNMASNLLYVVDMLNSAAKLSFPIMYFSNAMAYLYAIADKVGFDLEKHIIMKIEFNKSRGKKHGKKY